MNRNRRKESVIYDKADLPAGYVPLGTLATDTGSTPLYGYVQRAFERGDLMRSLFKCRGKRFIHQDDLDRLTAQFNARAASPQQDQCDSSTDGVASMSHGQCEAAVVALCEINNGIALMQATLERLTLAVESIATQPKTAHDRLLATVDGNGFHN